MTAEVSSLSRILNGGDNSDSGKSTALITRDLLGGRCTLLDFKELDLDMHVPSGWEKRLDLKSGKVYIQKRDSIISTKSDHEKKVNGGDAATSKLQDLNFPPTAKQPSISMTMSAGENNLDLKLVLFPTSSSTASPAASSSSVCTLDKVKSALERAERETKTKRRSMSKPLTSSSSSPPSHSSSSYIRDCDQSMEEEEKSSSTFAAGCPNCLLYVLVFRNNPKCPRCYSTVPSPNALKKPRIDLNISL